MCNRKKVRLFVMDVDGTLTDGKIYIGADGEIMKAFDVKDGYAIKHMLPAMGIVPAIITGRRSAIVERRAEELGIAELYQGVSEKLEILEKIVDKFGISFDEAAYIGDDENDLPCIERCGFNACPHDAADAVKQKAQYICRRNGGDGAIREFISWLKEHC